MSDRIYIGVDLGGTSIKVGICDQNGTLRHTLEGPTKVEEGAEAVIGRIVEYCRKIVQDTKNDWSSIVGVGAGIPGFLDMNDGFVKFSANLHWENVPVKRRLKELLNTRVEVNNDANVAALGESWSGAGAGIDNLVCYTLGTGVGGGIIIDRKILQGANGMAGELGHMTVVPDIEAIQCGCGQMGCLETVSSATGIIRMAKDAVERGENTMLALAENLTPKEIFQAAEAGDPAALRIIKRAAFYLGKSMAVLSVTINPKRFIVGGGVSKAGDILFDAIRESFQKSALPEAQEGVDIVPALLGNDAGVVGAAGLNLTHHHAREGEAT